MLEFVLEEKLRAMPWDTVTITMLQTMSPDQIKALDGLPSSWKASTVSLFLFGRSDWALFRKLLSLPVPCDNQKIQDAAKTRICYRDGIESIYTYTHI